MANALDCLSCSTGGFFVTRRAKYAGFRRVMAIKANLKYAWNVARLRCCVSAKNSGPTMARFRTSHTAVAFSRTVVPNTGNDDTRCHTCCSWHAGPHIFSGHSTGSLLLSCDATMTSEWLCDKAEKTSAVASTTKLLPSPVRRNEKCTTGLCHAMAGWSNE